MHLNGKFFNNFLAIFLSLSHICSSGYIHTMGEEEYSVITKLMRGESNNDVMKNMTSLSHLILKIHAQN